MNDDQGVELQTEKVGQSTSIQKATPQAGAIALRPGPGDSYALARLSDDEFAELLKLNKRQQTRMKQVVSDLMEPGVHYIVPGVTDKAKIREAAKTGKVGLSKAGTELLFKIYRFVGRVEYRIEYGDPKNETSPAVSVFSTCTVHADTLDGPVMGVGVGACTSWEEKYRWRNDQRKCPDCGQPALMLSKFEARGGEFMGLKPWWCNSKKDGCGKEFAPEDPRIVGQTVGRVANPNAHDQLNTIVKMSAKRSRTDGAINATSSSDLLTQDVEDLPKGTKFTHTPEGEIDTTLNDMYGGGNDDPDAWRKEVDSTTTTTTATAKPAAPAAPAARSGDELASPSQRNLIGVRLKSKFGATNATTQDAVLANQLGFPGGIASITKLQAGQLITKLNGMPDHVAGAAAESPKPAAPATDDTATREKYAQGIRDLAAQLTGANPNRVILSTIEGIVYVTGSNEQAVLGVSGPIALDTLTAEQMMMLGTYLRQEQNKKAQAA